MSFIERWKSFLILLAIVLAILCWPVTLALITMWILTKLFGVHL